MNGFFCSMWSEPRQVRRNIGHSPHLAPQLQYYYYIHVYPLYNDARDWLRARHVQCINKGLGLASMTIAKPFRNHVFLWIIRVISVIILMKCVSRTHVDIGLHERGSWMGFRAECCLYPRLRLGYKLAFIPSIPFMNPEVLVNVNVWTKSQASAAEVIPWQQMY